MSCEEVFCIINLKLKSERKRTYFLSGIRGWEQNLASIQGFANSNKKLLGAGTPLTADIARHWQFSKIF